MPRSVTHLFLLQKISLVKVYFLKVSQYCFLQQQCRFDFCSCDTSFQAVPSFFNARIDEAKALQPGVDWSVDRVLDVIRTSSRSWRNDRLRPFPELKFSYEEEQSPEEFFVPLVWSLVVMHSPIPWNTVNTILLTSMLETAPSLDSDSVSLDIPPSSSHSRNGVPSRISAQEIVESP